MNKFSQQKPEIQVPPAEHLPNHDQPKGKNRTLLIILIIVLLLICVGAAYYFLVYLKNKDEVDQDNNTNIVQEYSFGNDADQDGLSDRVETWFGTDINDLDTDDDGYTDYNEIDSCFNPVGTGYMTTTIYKRFCEKDLAHEYEDLSESEIKLLCNEWSDFAQLVIDSRMSDKGDVDVPPSLARVCEKTKTILNNTNIGSLCDYHIVSTVRFCDVNSLNKIKD